MVKEAVAVPQQKPTNIYGLLGELGLEDYTGEFKDRAITMENVHLLEKDDLSFMKVGHRATLWNYISSMPEKGAAGSPPPANTSPGVGESNQLVFNPETGQIISP